MPKIAIYYSPNNRRSRIVSEGMLHGARLLGIPVDYLASTSYRGNPAHDVAIFYGLADGLKRVFHDYGTSSSRRAVYIDLGYWGRRKRTRFDGYHKFVVDGRHPTAYFQLHRHPHDRFNQLGIPIHPWRAVGSHILLAGMSGKGAAAEGFRPEQWEAATVEALRRVTDRPIIYRPKPNWPCARLIPGTIMQTNVPLQQALADCHCVVTHHSNTAIEGLLAGVPCITADGVASVFNSSIDDIENPVKRDGREQWAADLAYCQWSVDEMRQGLALRHLLDEGLI